ncbi:chymotrypsin-like elastase family member 2B [Hyalella azteca]|uniref:Chymotrypsin-like elastase family member 2B n=1 Tax=Hyalella azteca TaxID=294128 RepID=A0A8B7NM53_HYAAZ|nr:chymotrypsin-like elastase family member 2B [Hyalella azteca]
MWHSRLSCVAAILLTVIKATLAQRCTVGGTQSNPGRCTPLRNCPQLADKFQPLDIANFIATHACGVEQSGTNDVLVCCPLVIAASGSISSGPRPEPVTCGSRKAAEDGADWPFMVGLGAVAPGQGLTIVYCNGALVAPLWVLTDASCLQQNLISTAFLGLGRADRSKIVSVPVVFTRRPTDFDSARDLNALALVKLGQPVSATDDIQFVCLPTSRGYDPSSPRYALYVTHIDDGSVAGGFDVAERSLHSVSLTQCRASAGISVYPSDYHLCTNGLQACVSGNVRMSRPLLVGLGEGGGFVLLGVGGVTNDRCTSDVTAFTEISKFDHWLKAIME